MKKFRPSGSKLNIHIGYMFNKLALIIDRYGSRIGKFFA